MIFYVIAQLKWFIGQIATLGAYLVLGAIVGFLGAALRGWIGAAGAALMGAVIMFVGLTYFWSTDDKDKVARLEAEKRRLEAKNLELVLTTQETEKLVQQLSEASEYNEAQIGVLKSIIEKAGDQCSLPEDARDAINSIR